MKTSKFALASILLASLFASGCIFVSDDDDDDGVTVTDGIFHSTWLWAGNQDCVSTQVDTVEYLYTLQGTTDGDAVLFDCDAGAGDSNVLALGDYTYVVTALDCSLVPTSPTCAGGVNRGSSSPVTDTFLAGCDATEGTTCIVDLATTTLQVTL